MNELMKWLPRAPSLGAAIERIEELEVQIKRTADFIETYNTDAGRSPNGYYNEVLAVVHEMLEGSVK
jgi:hypothetical protein